MVNSFEHFAVNGQLEFLEELDLSNNCLKSLDHFELKNLKKLNLTKNQITTAENFKGHPSLETLILDKNQIETLKDLKNMPTLNSLILIDNPIKEFSGLENNT